MTNQASELYELCKDVYGRFPEWVGVDYFFHTYELHGSERTDVMTIYDHNFPLSIEHMGLVPLYTSDYLLEKLPEYVTEYDSYHEQDISNYLCVMKVPDGYVALYDGLSLAHKVKVQRADTPLKALLKLTIALSEAGELK